MKRSLLGEGNRQRRSIEEIKEHCNIEEEAGRGHNPGMGATIHAKHLGDENSWIA